MGTLSKFNPIARAAGVMGVTAALVTGVTFAAFSSTATLTGNTISAADSNLLIYDGTTFAETAPGFDVEDIVPGEFSDDNLFYLQNDSPGDLTVYAHVKEAPMMPAEGYGFSGWENLVVKFKGFTCGEEKVTDMQALLDGNVEMPCNTLAEGAQGNNQAGAETTAGNYSVSYKIESDSVDPNAEDISVGEFDLQFIGNLGTPTDEVVIPPTESTL